MSTTIERSPVEFDVRPPVQPKRPNRLLLHLARNPVDYVLVTILVTAALATRVWNLSRYPRLFTDENVYVSQAWAVQFMGRIANYTYWYDHPFIGWTMMAIYSALTGSLERHEDLTTMSGREFMVVMFVAGAVLLYVLARRLHYRRALAFTASALWILSPLSVSFTRYVLLDNIDVVWVIAAMVLALSPRRKLSAAVGSGVCMAVAALSKEMALLLWPAVLLMLVRHYWRQADFRPFLQFLRHPFHSHGRGNRIYAIVVSLGTTVAIGALYPAYAIFKNELFPGPGHVSLVQGQILFQLASREGSGNILQAGSDARLLAENAWLALDPWLPWAGLAALAVALFIPRLWGPVLALGVQALLLVVRSGYLPYPYIIPMLPFMALLVAGVVDAFWPTRRRLRGRWYAKVAAVLGVLVTLGLATGAAVYVAPAWQDKLTYELTADETGNQRAALDWAEANLDHQSRMVTEGEYWLDTRFRGFNNPQVVWVYKLDTDSAVQAEYGSVAGLDYLLLNKSTIDAAGRGTYPTLQKAIQEATVLATFGPDNEKQVVVLRVNHEQ